MKNYVIGVVVMVLLAGTFHMLFIGFDYMFHSPTDGAIPKMTEVMNETLNDQFRNSSYNMTQMLRNAFGYMRVICIGLVFLIVAIGVTRKPRGEQ